MAGEARPHLHRHSSSARFQVTARGRICRLMARSRTSRSCCSASGSPRAWVPDRGDRLWGERVGAGAKPLARGSGVIHHRRHCLLVLLNQISISTAGLIPLLALWRPRAMRLRWPVSGPEEVGHRQCRFMSSWPSRPSARTAFWAAAPVSSRDCVPVPAGPPDRDVLQCRGLNPADARCN